MEESAVRERQIKLLAIPLRNQRTVAKWLVNEKHETATKHISCPDIPIRYKLQTPNLASGNTPLQILSAIYNFALFVSFADNA